MDWIISWLNNTDKKHINTNFKFASDYLNRIIHTASEIKMTLFGQKQIAVPTDKLYLNQDSESCTV